MLIIKDFLNGDNVCLKEVVSPWTEQNGTDVICQVGTTLTPYADVCATLVMTVIMTCSLMVNGPGLIRMPKREIFGM